MIDWVVLPFFLYNLYIFSCFLACLNFSLLVSVRYRIVAVLTLFHIPTFSLTNYCYLFLTNLCGKAGTDVSGCGKDTKRGQ